MARSMRSSIDEIWLVADEFKLAQADGACEDTGGDGSGDDDACEKFETPPFFVPVPVDGDNWPRTCCVYCSASQS